MQQLIQFKTIIEQDEDGVYVASCPAIPGCRSQGKTYEDAVANIEDAIKLCLAVAKTDPDYRKSIDFNLKKSNRFIGISDILIPKPAYL
jgi:predicted RNase H-like HicB family nuclease